MGNAKSEEKSDEKSLLLKDKEIEMNVLTKKRPNNDSVIFSSIYLDE